MYLFLDTETTGLPKNWNAPESDLNNWPRIVQIAWLRYDASEKQVLKNNYVVKPDGFSIPAAATKIHGISTQKAEKEGAPLKQVLNEFSSSLNKSKFLVTHNVDFDKKIVGAEFLRMGFKNNLSEIQKICTMQASTNFCRIPNSSYGYKWPSLMELHTRLFKSAFEERHDALADATACAKCFFELKKKGIIRVN